KESDIPILGNPSSCGCNMFQHKLWHSGLTLPRPYPRKRDSIALRTAEETGSQLSVRVVDVDVAAATAATCHFYGSSR
ncbi:MAG TPA: hypothetical protein VJY39_21395, partial [Acidisphaera sp.]|nr:hypothetical protein [Acidisphaera sp.]